MMVNVFGCRKAAEILGCFSAMFVKDFWKRKMSEISRWTAVKPRQQNDDVVTTETMSTILNTDTALTLVGTTLAKQWQEQAEKSATLQDQLLRTRADWDNSRKRLQKEKEDAIKYAATDVVEKLLPVIDNFELGLQAAQNAADVKSLQDGMTMIYAQFSNFLREIGVETVAAEGQKFDPHSHEAVGEKESSEVEDGHVLQQLRKGYRLKDRLLRPAMVYVAKSSV
jgi:molecular chaperone GrpE